VPVLFLISNIPIFNILVAKRGLSECRDVGEEKCHLLTILLLERYRQYNGGNYSSSNTTSILMLFIYRTLGFCKEVLYANLRASIILSQSLPGLGCRLHDSLENVVPSRDKMCTKRLWMHVFAVCIRKDVDGNFLSLRKLIKEWKKCHLLIEGRFDIERPNKACE